MKMRTQDSGDDDDADEASSYGGWIYERELQVVASAA